MKLSKMIALSSLVSAFCAVLLYLGALFPTLSLSCIFLASLTIMLPLAKKSYKGAILAVVASSILSFLLAAFSFETSLPFILFFGFHPIINRFQKDKKLNKFLLFAIKDIWCVGALFACYFLTEMFVTENEFFHKYMPYILSIGGTLFFIVYDYMMFYFQRAIDRVAERLKL
ncbi:MAG: hypothetical protein IJA76_03635 [Clostridia bacterium]|nr:hypothetical protein [Clostridia bacterium]MBQ4586720.1 hypothetical protein [Clostridia bacterium]MBQ6883424.1 hypothetical protein [Clostridia bacterium]